MWVVDSVYFLTKTIFINCHHMIFGGFKFVVSNAEDEKMKKNKRTPDDELNSSVDRRTFAKRVIRTALFSSFALNASAKAAATLSPQQYSWLSNNLSEDYEYVVIGSGAGGGPLAANLARKGYRVLVLEAGDADPASDVHDIPAWHPKASEDPKISWEFFVKHYADKEQQEKDSKHVLGEGIFYPRGSTLGGSTAVHAMITVYPHHSDFDRIAQITGDDSWNSKNMRQYFQRLENCEYLLSPPFSDNSGQHGFDGWLPTTWPDLSQLLEEPKLLYIVKSALLQYGLGDIFEQLLTGQLKLDINDINAEGKEGLFIAPMAANRFGRRQSVREYLLETQRLYPDKLHILTNALATKILFDGTTAVGVEYKYGANLYRADRLHDEDQLGEFHQVHASREVILSGGAFNSPQLLKLSGVGPEEELRQHGIKTIVNLPGVGENLQDRYEVGVVSKLKEEFELTADCTWGEGNDPCLERYKKIWWSRGPYTTNGATISVVKRSKPELEDPDLFIFGLPSEFAGYYPGYSKTIESHADRFTWVILKAHTNNNAGRVLLKSADPQDAPDINFHYFHEGSDRTGDDLRAVVEGVKVSREIMNVPLAKNLIQKELIPGPQYQSDDDIAEFVVNEAWGHHASCTNKMGAQDDRTAVVDSKFRVFGTRNLRVVDASVFPYIPGFFIVVPVYMISEKASDDIVATARGVEFQTALSIETSVE